MTSTGPTAPAEAISGIRHREPAGDPDAVRTRVIRRRDLLGLAAAVPAAAVGWNILRRFQGSPRSSVAPATGRTFFVSPVGNDNAVGSMAMPWRTIDSVNRRVADGTLRDGDSVLFRSGAVFYGKIRLAWPDSSPALFTVGAYGGGPGVTRPVISSYKILDVVRGWRLTGVQEWASDLSSAAVAVTHHGYSGAQGGADNIGFLRVDGVVKGRRVSARTGLAQQWDFCCVGTTLYVRSAKNPTEMATDLRAACGETCIEITDGLRIVGLRFEGGGGHGAQGTASHVRITDNEFCELGGSLLDPSARYGNGVEIWIGSSDVVVERNVFHDIYDVALTMQGSQDSDVIGWNAISFRENLVFRCSQSIEFWSAGKGQNRKGFAGCTVERNICLFAGYGWSGTVRPDQEVRVHLLTYGWSLPADILVTANVFYDAVSAYRYSSSPTPGLVTSGNTVLLRSGTLMRSGSPQTIENATQWAIGSNEEFGSSFAVLDRATAVDVGTALRQLRDGTTVRLDEPAHALLDEYIAQNHS
jgi:hypothetical protein